MWSLFGTAANTYVLTMTHVAATRLAASRMAIVAKRRGNSTLQGLLKAYVQLRHDTKAHTQNEQIPRASNANCRAATSWVPRQPRCIALPWCD